MVRGDVQLTNAPLSTAHLNVEPLLVEWNVNVGVLSFVGPLGPESITVSGADVSTEKSRVAGDASTLPAESMARTRKVWSPSLNAAVVCGEVQLAKAPPSTAHSKVEPVSLEWNVKVGVLSPVAPDGPVSIVVSGALTSCCS